MIFAGKTTTLFLEKYQNWLDSVLLSINLKICPNPIDSLYDVPPGNKCGQLFFYYHGFFGYVNAVPFGAHYSSNCVVKHRFTATRFNRRISFEVYL